MGIPNHPGSLHPYSSSFLFSLEQSPAIRMKLKADVMFGNFDIDRKSGKFGDHGTSDLATSLEVTLYKSWFRKGLNPPNPLNSGLGILVICPDGKGEEGKSC